MRTHAGTGYTVASTHPADSTSVVSRTCVQEADRGIGYGFAFSVPWQRTMSDGVVTYVNTGERVSFELHSGFPIPYEVGLRIDGVAKVRTTYVVDQR